MELALPAYRPIRISSAIDRYGFSSCLAREFRLPIVPRSFANWVHGWIWAEDPNAETLGCKRSLRSIRTVVTNENERQALLRDGFDKVIPGGLPFAYVPQQTGNRVEGSLLAFLPHSSEALRQNSLSEEYLDFLASIRADFQHLHVCIYYLDCNDGLMAQIVRRGMTPVSGARPDDANSLLRMRRLLDQFEYATTNVMGSHVAYALYAGCKVSLSGPHYGYTEMDMFANGNPHRLSMEYVARFLELQSERYLRNRFGWLFQRHPQDGNADITFGRTVVGEEYILPETDIRQWLGWTLTGQIHGYTVGAFRRIKSVFQ